jgi:hypothetical protein
MWLKRIAQRYEAGLSFFPHTVEGQQSSGLKISRAFPFHVKRKQI